MRIGQRTGTSSAGGLRRRRPEAPAKSRASAVSRVIARIVIIGATTDAEDRGDDVAGERGDEQTDEDPARPPALAGQHRDHQLGLVAPSRKKGGDERK